MNIKQKIKISERGVVLISLFLISTVITCSYLGSLIALLAGDDIMRDKLFIVGNWSWLPLFAVIVVMVMFSKKDDVHARQRKRRIRNRRSREKRGYPRPNVEPTQPSPEKPKAKLRRVK